MAYVVESEQKNLEIFALDVLYQPSTNDSAAVLSANAPILLGSFPTTSASNFRYSTDGYLVFSDSVYSDGNLTTVKEQDEAWENRGNTALVYDRTYERHWDHWVGPKTQSLFSVRLVQDPNHMWTFGSEFVNLLAGTGHVSLYSLRINFLTWACIFSQSSPVEPFGGTDDFYVSKQSVIYTTLDPAFEEERAWHTKQNVGVFSLIRQFSTDSWIRYTLSALLPQANLGNSLPDPKAQHAVLFSMMQGIRLPG